MEKNNENETLLTVDDSIVVSNNTISSTLYGNIVTIDPYSTYSTSVSYDYEFCTKDVVEREVEKKLGECKDDFIKKICSDERFEEDFSLVQKYIIGYLDKILDDPGSIASQVIQDLKRENQELRKEIDDIKRKLEI